MDGGTYLTLHDHLLINILPEYLMENLSKVRQFGQNIEKQNVKNVIIGLLREHLGFGKGQEKEKRRR